METATLIMLIITIVLAIACVVLAVLKFRDWSAAERSAILSQMYALAKTVYTSLQDGKLEAAEIKILFNQVIGIIASIAGRHTDEVEAEFDKLNPTYTIAQTTE